MALLNHDKALFYLSCDDTHEPIQNKTWVLRTQPSAQFVGGQIVNSGIWVSGSADCWLGYSNIDNAYTNPSGVIQGFTCVAWVSGFNESQTRRVHIGWSNGNQIAAENGIFFENYGVGGNQSGISLYVRSRHASWDSGLQSPRWIVRDDPFMVAGHAVWLTDNLVSGFLSVNGDEWIPIGSGVLNKPDNSWGRAMTAGVQSVSNPEIPRALDEVVMWVDGPMPTNTQLMKMYRMGLNGTPLNQFDNFFEPGSGSILCFLKSATPSSGTMPVWMGGRDNTSGTTPVAAEGHIGVSNTISCVALGLSNSDPVSIDCFTAGHLVSSGQIPMSVSGIPGPANGSRPLFAEGYLGASGTISAFASGIGFTTTALPVGIPDVIDFASGDMSAFIQAAFVGSGSMAMYTVGPLPASGRTDLFGWGHAIGSGATPLAIVYPPFAINDAPLYLRGVGSGSVADFTIEDLLRTGDHNPQILGRLDYLGSEDVFIEVWDITEGRNTPVPIGQSGCYPIGDTGRWGWSTKHLPAWSVRHPLYYYRMIAPNGMSFEGQFFMGTPYQNFQHPEKDEVTIITH